jgi:hypothetical protein
MKLSVPDGAAFGLEKVYVDAWVTSALTSDIKLDVYRFNTSTALGERIGGGYISASEITPSTSYQRIGIPIITSDGELEEQSFLNITGDVLIVVSGEDGICFPTLMMKVTGPWHCSAYYLLDVFDTETNEVTDTNYLAIATRQTWSIIDDGLKVVSFCFFYDGEYTWIESDDDVDALEVTLPAAGGKQNLTLYPYSDFFDASQFSGEGVDEWLYVYADQEQDSDTGAQDVVFEAEALPDGVAGRATKVLVEIPGAQVTVTVKQGDTSGLDTIDGDASDVVSSQIYDLQGRKLNAVPQSGLYIRRDVKANNTVTTTKVVK